MFESLVLPLLLAVATAAGVGMIVPQAVRLHRTKVTDGVSPTWVGVGLIMNAWWLAYAAASGLWGLVPVSVGGITLYGIVAAQLLRLLGPTVLSAVARGHLIGLVPLAGLVVDGWPGAGLVIGLLYGAAFTPAVTAAVRSASVVGISPTTWVLAWIEAAVWLLYGSTTADVALIAGGLGGTIMSSIILVRLATAQPALAGRLPVALVGGR
ncbi:MAG: hypothetical protein AAGA93_14710 [Actinomycetota bacterium]